MARLLLTMLLGTWALNGPPATASPSPHLIAYVRHGSVLTLRDRPFGRVVGRIDATTPFGSPRALGVLALQRGRWLGVSEAAFGHNRLVWIDARRRGLRYRSTRLELSADLSRRTLTLRRDDVLVRSMRIAVGGPRSPTPTGRFAVTDKLDGRRYSPAYGCCILALSATQSRLPRGWAGGDRIAIHGAPSDRDVGRGLSAGCLHAAAADLRYLMRVVPLGTPVVILP